MCGKRPPAQTENKKRGVVELVSDLLSISHAAPVWMFFFSMLYPFFSIWRGVYRVFTGKRIKCRKELEAVSFNTDMGHVLVLIVFLPLLNFFLFLLLSTIVERKQLANTVIASMSCNLVAIALFAPVFIRGGRKEIVI